MTGSCIRPLTAPKKTERGVDLTGFRVTITLTSHTYQSLLTAGASCFTVASHRPVPSVGSE